MLIGFIMKHGRKRLATRIVNEAVATSLRELEIRDDQDGVKQLFDRLEFNMMIGVDFFKRRIGARHHRIPYMMTEERAYRRSLKIFYRFTKNAEGPYVGCLANAMVELYRGGGKFCTHKFQVYRDAYAGRMYLYLIRNFRLNNPDALKLSFEPKFVKD